MATKLLKPSKYYHPCLKILFSLLRANNGKRSDTGRVAAYRTMDPRRTTLKKCFTDLYNGGFIIKSPKNLKPKHLQFIIDKLVAEGRSASTFNNYKSHLNTLCEWIGKSGMMNHVDLSAVPKEMRQRKIEAVEDKDWSTKPEFWSIINAILLDDIVVGIQLLLMFAFGLRANEAMCLKLSEADKGMFLYLEHGTKGGLKRIVPIDNDLQRQVLEFTKAIYPALVDPDEKKTTQHKLKQWRQHFYYICGKKHGLTRANKMVPHGLRHGYAQRVFELASGVMSPIRSGLHLDKTNKINKAMLKTSKRLGHSRLNILSAYIGK